jgi:AcrR family transcriptional regulator
MTKAPWWVDLSTDMQINSGVNIYLRIGRIMETARRARGRPKQLVGADVLGAVTGVFWDKGYSGASLADLADAAGVSRPSLYETLGDKRTMYLAAIGHVIAMVEADQRATLSGAQPLAAELLGFFDHAIAVYAAGDMPRGCLVMCTAPAEALEEPLVQAALARVIAALDAGFEARFRLAQQRGELPAGATPAALAMQATALLQSLALRARSGTPAMALRGLAASAAAMLATGPVPRSTAA